jgi:hypothetical protein
MKLATFSDVVLEFVDLYLLLRGIIIGQRVARPRMRGFFNYTHQSWRYHIQELDLFLYLSTSTPALLSCHREYTHLSRMCGSLSSMARGLGTGAVLGIQ